MISSSLLAGSVDPAMLTQIAHEIAEVEKVLLRETGSDVELVRSVCSHTLKAGGKRLRPALVTLCARAVARPFEAERSRRIGACMEMIHMATLIHDDVIDGALLRRAAPTAAAAFGNTPAILSGDVLLAKAMAILAADGDLEIIRLVSGAVVELAEGEVAELTTRSRLDLSEDEHMAILRQKTASFIEACCKSGGVLAGGTADENEALSRFGHHVGLAFQLVDDLLDYQGKAEETGKPRATDFREGCPTLPLILLLPMLGEVEKNRVEASFGCAEEADVDFVVSLMRSKGSFEKVASRIDEHMRLANESLDALPSSPSLDLLRAVSHFIRARNW